MLSRVKAQLDKIESMDYEGGNADILREMDFQELRDLVEDISNERDEDMYRLEEKLDLAKDWVRDMPAVPNYDRVKDLDSFFNEWDSLAEAVEKL